MPEKRTERNPGLTSRAHNKTKKREKLLKKEKNKEIINQKEDEEI